MTIAQFDSFTVYPKGRLRSFGVLGSDLGQLTAPGLPTWCAPNMHFGQLGDSAELLPLVVVQGKPYLGLGEDRDDRTILLAVEGHTIWVRTEAECLAYFASSVAILAEALRRFQRCIDAIVGKDRSAAVENRLPPTTFDSFISWLSGSDPMALTDGAFWRETLRWARVPNNSIQRTQTRYAGSRR